MKLYITLSGKFNRTPINDQPRLESINLLTWMQSYQAVATEVRQGSPQSLRKNFGLQFLSEAILSKIVQQTYKTQSQQLLPFPVTKPIFYYYRFINADADIKLQPDDPQIPSFWKQGETSQTGVYEVILETNDYPGVSKNWLNSLWQMGQDIWQNYTPLTKIQMALQSFDSTGFYFNLGDHLQVKVKIENKQLNVNIQEAISYLRNPQTELSHLSTVTQALIQEYQKIYNISPSYFQFPQDLKLNESIHFRHQFIIGKRKSRKAIENLVNEAEQFILVSSYIIEDEYLTQLICAKVEALPQGVWVLTDLRDEVVNRLDTNRENQADLPSAYQKSDERKVKCLTNLLNAGCHIRGGTFHLKTYICEKAAYLGSCNLTGGSLDFNLEGGLICQESKTHQDLLQYFIHFWQYQTEYDVIPSSTNGNYIQRSVDQLLPPSPFTSQTLLIPSEYRDDLKQELSKFRGEVKIYSRGFSPDMEILSLLPTHSTHLYTDAFTSSDHHHFSQYFLVSGLHAKVTLLGDRVAYIGGVNFQFNQQAFSLIDLMYKTKNLQEIKQIRQQLAI